MISASIAQIRTQAHFPIETTQVSLLLLFFFNKINMHNSEKYLCLFPWVIDISQCSRIPWNFPLKIPYKGCLMIIKASLICYICVCISVKKNHLSLLNWHLYELCATTHTHTYLELIREFFWKIVLLWISPLKFIWQIQNWIFVGGFTVKIV